MMLDKIKNMVMVTAQFLKVQRNRQLMEKKYTRLHIKRSCPDPKCRNSMEDDYPCARCAQYKGTAEFRIEKYHMIGAERRRQVYQYIRDTCNNDRCSSAPEFDLEAHTCVVCLDLQGNATRYKQVEHELEVMEDKGIRSLICGSFDHPQGCTGNHKIGNIITGYVFCRTCTCISRSALQDPCICGKSSKLYKNARREYMAMRDCNFRKAEVLAYIRGRCDKSSCNEAAKLKIVRYKNTIPTITSGPPCTICQDRFDGGKAESHKYQNAYRVWSATALQYHELLKHLRGSCKNAPCYFSVSHAKKLNGFCPPCWYMMKYNQQGKVREMNEEKNKAKKAAEAHKKREKKEKGRAPQTAGPSRAAHIDGEEHQHLANIHRGTGAQIDIQDGSLTLSTAEHLDLDEETALVGHNPFGDTYRDPFGDHYRDPFEDDDEDEDEDNEL